MNDPQFDAMFNLLGILPAATRQEMVRMYSDALVGQTELLGECVARRDVPACTSVSHKIAGSAAMMQDHQLAQAARSMERALIAGRWEDALAHWPQTQACAAATLAGLRARYPDPG